MKAPILSMIDLLNMMKLVIVIPPKVPFPCAKYSITPL
jgi:hypothetical protein